jgi:predicted secreted protein
MQTSLTVLISVLITLAAATHAADTSDPFNRVSLSASANRMVDNDRMVLVLFAQADGKDAASPAREVNEAMAWALSKAAQVPQVTTQTLAYQTNANYKDGRIRGWRVRQSLRLESEDAALLGDLAGSLQQRLGIQSVEYRLSESRRRAHIAELTDEALQRFTERSEQVAKSLGRNGYRLVRISINDHDDRPRPMVRTMAAEASVSSAAPPPRFEAGTQSITVAVSGEIALFED